MRTVSQEMSNAERCKRLITGFKINFDNLDEDSEDKEVTCNVSHLAQALGMETVEKVALNLTESREIAPKAYSKVPKLTRGGMVTVSVRQVYPMLVEALEKLEKEEPKEEESNDQSRFNFGEESE